MNEWKYERKGKEMLASAMRVKQYGVNDNIGAVITSLKPLPHCESENERSAKEGEKNVCVCVCVEGETSILFFLSLSLFIFSFFCFLFFFHPCGGVMENIITRTWATDGGSLCCALLK